MMRCEQGVSQAGNTSGGPVQVVPTVVGAGLPFFFGTKRKVGKREGQMRIGDALELAMTSISTHLLLKLPEPE